MSSSHSTFKKNEDKSANSVKDEKNTMNMVEMNESQVLKRLKTKGE